MAAPTEAKRKPGWMSIPGGPKEPNFQDFKKKFNDLVAEKKKCFDELTSIRAQFDAGRENRDSDDIDKERSELRKRLQNINQERQKERDSRRTTDEALKSIRNDRRKIEAQLRELSNEVGAFSSVEEIDAAIGIIEYKMETGGGDLAFEKRTIKRLNQLEEAKGLLQKLEPLSEAIADAEEREAELQSEFREIHARIDALNKDYEKQLGVKMEKDKLRTKNTFDFSGLIKKRETVRENIDKLNKQIDELRANFNKGQEAWNAWRIEAQAKFKKQMDEQRAERERVWKEREASRKLERRRAKAAKKLNPHAGEIDAATSLIRYLEDKLTANKRDKEAAERRKQLAAFNPSANAPAGAQVAGHEDEWLFADRTKKGGAKPAAAKPAEKKEKKDNAPPKEQKNKVMQHSVEKYRAFEICGVEVPMTYGAIPSTVEQLKNKKKEWEAKIIANVDDVDVTSSEDENDEEAVASTAVTEDTRPAEAA